MVSGNSYQRFLQTPEGESSFFLFGLRGVGKSTWAREHYPGCVRVDLLREATYQDYLRSPGLFAAEMERLAHGSRVVVDEVQRLPFLLNEVHRLIEERRLRFVLLGSSARKLKQAGTNLLAGRALRRVMFPLLPGELGDDFRLDEVLAHGSVPIIWNARDKRETLTAYVQMYLREEIQAEALVRNLPGFARFLPVAALFHGQVLNIAGLARDAGVARMTVTGYLEILADTYFAWMLPGYEARLRVKERRHPKFYWTDPGIVRAVRGEFHPPTEAERGPLFEGLVGMILRAYGETPSLLPEPFDQLCYWAPAQGSHEVDFLIRKEDVFTAIEVKAKTALSSRDFKGLRAAAELPGLRRRLVVFLGERPFRTPDGIDALPFLHFVEELVNGKLW